MRLLYLMALCSSIGASQSSTQQKVKDKNVYKAYILDNGIKVVLVHSPLFKDTALCSAVDISHMDRSANNPGFTEFAELMVDIILNASPSENAHPYAAAEIDNAPCAITYTSNVMYFAFTRIQEDLTKVIRRLGSAFTSLEFKDRDIKKALWYISKVSAQAEHSACHIYGDFLNAMLAKCNPDRLFHHFNPIICESSRQDLKELLSSYWKTHFIGKNISIVISSNLDIERLATMAGALECIPSQYYTLEEILNDNELQDSVTDSDGSYNFNIDTNMTYAGRLRKSGTRLFLAEFYQHIYEKQIKGKHAALIVTTFVPGLLSLRRSFSMRFVYQFYKNALDAMLVPLWVRAGWAHGAFIEIEESRDDERVCFRIALTKLGQQYYNEVLDGLADFLKSLSFPDQIVQCWNQKTKKTPYEHNTPSALENLKYIAGRALIYPLKDVLLYSRPVDNDALKHLNTFRDQIADSTSWIVIILTPGLDKDHGKKSEALESTHAPKEKRKECYGVNDAVQDQLYGSSIPLYTPLIAVENDVYNQARRTLSRLGAYVVIHTTKNNILLFEFLLYLTRLSLSRFQAPADCKNTPIITWIFLADRICLQCYGDPKESKTAMKNFILHFENPDARCLKGAQALSFWCFSMLYDWSPQIQRQLDCIAGLSGESLALLKLQKINLHLSNKNKRKTYFGELAIGENILSCDSFHDHKANAAELLAATSSSAMNDEQDRAEYIMLVPL